jgi:hypothetical protein
MNVKTLERRLYKLDLGKPEPTTIVIARYIVEGKAADGERPESKLVSTREIVLTGRTQSGCVR